MSRRPFGNTASHWLGDGEGSPPNRFEEEAGILLRSSGDGLKNENDLWRQNGDMRLISVQ